MAMVISGLNAQHNYDNQSIIYGLNDNIGITTTNPQARLHVNALERQAFRIYRENFTDKYLSLWHGTGGAVIEPIRSDNSNGILFLGGYDSPTNVFFARNGGNVAIGTTDVQSKLHLNALERQAFRIYRENYTDKYLSLWHGTGGAVIEPIRSDGSTGVLFLGGYDSPTNVFFSRNGGNVAIGTTDVRAKLHLNALERQAFRIYRENYTDKYLSIWHGTGGAVIEPIRSDGSTGVLFLGGYDSPTDVFFSRNGGNVAIGTTDTMGYKLAVNGNIRAKEIVIEASPWPDFVFKEDYHLPTLTEVDAYIKSKGHLPNIPSEQEVLENGIGLGTLNAKLLQKIEELTLYTIQQEEKLNTLQETIKTMQASLNALKNQQ